MRKHKHHHKKQRNVSYSRMQQTVRLLPAVFFLLAAIAGLFFGTRFLDQKMNDTALETDTYEGRASTTYERGSLVLDDRVFDYYHNFENFLFMGTDVSGNTEAEGEDYSNNMADFLLLLTIDKTADTFTMLELNRDTIAEIRLILHDGSGEATAMEQLCTAHSYGGTETMGCENQVRAVSTLLGGLPISGYYSLHMEDIGLLNAAIGGVTVTLEHDLSSLDPAMKKGAVLTLTDEQAEIFLRARMSVGQGTNEERMARQHAYMSAFMEQSRDKLSASPKYYYNLFENMESFAVTNLTGKQISRIAAAMTGKEYKGLTGFEGESRLGRILGDGIDHAEFYIDPDSLVTVMTDLFGLKENENATARRRENLDDGEEDDGGRPKLEMLAAKRRADKAASEEAASEEETGDGESGPEETETVTE